MSISVCTSVPYVYPCPYLLTNHLLAVPRFPRQDVRATLPGAIGTL